MIGRIYAILALVTLLAGPVAAESPSWFAIRGARIVPVSGAPIDNGTVVVHDGLITAVGANVSIPPAAMVIEGKGLVVYPGLVDALSTIGLPETGTTAAAGASRFTPAATPAPPAATEPATRSQGSEDRPQTTTWVHAADLISISDRRIEAARNAGVTTAVVAPSRGIFPGFSALIDLAGERPGNMVVKSPVGLHITFPSGFGFGSGSGFPGSLMGIIAYVKQTFLDARQYQQAWSAYRESPRGHKRPQYDRALEYIQPVLSGTVPVFVPASTEVQIRRYLDLAREFGTPFVLYGTHEAYRVAPLLAERKVPVLVSAKWPEKERDGDPEEEDSLRALRLRDRAPSTPAALHKAGARFAFYSDGVANPRDYVRNVKKAIDAGLPADAALRALTLTPAELVGAADVVGSIEPGKIANLVVTDGDLFADRTKVKYVFVDGLKFTVPEEATPAAPAGPGRAAPAADATGTWALTIERPDGPINATLELKQEGASLTGGITSAMGAAEILSGSATGDQITFRVKVAHDGPPIEITFRGRISGNSISGTLSSAAFPNAMNFSGSRSAAPQQQEGEE